MPVQTLSICNSHPPLAPSLGFTNPLKTPSLFIFKTHHKPTKKTHNCYRKLTVFAVKEDEEQPTPSWAKPGSEEPPPWARNETQQQSSSSFELPFFVYLLASAITAIAAIGSVFEYVNQKPVFGLLNSDSIFYAPVLGFFAFTGVPTAAFLWFKSVEVANKEAEEQDRRDSYR
ncbi:hypothetical protein L1987_71319 [Smallanthus sonchifolius]|uniref:Uncharacterized protein n=1 Tax=Smallanthus sonchifolius TaxID=185202 RepID=A0ACB9ARA2_9ASTR|nr:hypothetical protein L1987_71319 [Smallanthus sonchifolius]